MDTLRARMLAFVAIACLLVTEPNTVLSQSITGDILGTVQESLRS